MSDEKIINAEYADFVNELKDRIRTSQYRASLAVNTELIKLYWTIGRDILLRQQQQGWGGQPLSNRALRWSDYI